MVTINSPASNELLGKRLQITSRVSPIQTNPTDKNGMCRPTAKHFTDTSPHLLATAAGTLQYIYGHLHNKCSISDNEVSQRPAAYILILSQHLEQTHVENPSRNRLRSSRVHWRESESRTRGFKPRHRAGLQLASLHLHSLQDRKSCKILLTSFSYIHHSGK